MFEPSRFPRSPALADEGIWSAAAKINNDLRVVFYFIVGATDWILFLLNIWVLWDKMHIVWHRLVRLGFPAHQ